MEVRIHKEERGSGREGKQARDGEMENSRLKCKWKNTLIPSLSDLSNFCRKILIKGVPLAMYVRCAEGLDLSLNADPCREYPAV